MIQDFKKILFRCSSLGYIMTEPRSKSEIISETTKSHLLEKFIEIKYGRKKDIMNKYIAKGLAVEEDAITLYSRFRGKFFKKNSERLENEFITGEPDLFEGETIRTATHIIDTKCSWDIFTFIKTFHEKLNKNYYWQAMGYMALTGATSATIAYCLIDTPEVMIMDEQRRLMWKMNVSESDNNFISACDKIEKNMKYNDIPIHERINEIKINREREL